MTLSPQCRARLDQHFADTAETFNVQPHILGFAELKSCTSFNSGLSFFIRRTEESW